METTARRPQLPALNYLDADKVKREDEAHHLARTSATAPSSLPAMTMTTSTTYHPPGPPPPYHYSGSHQTASWSDKIAGVHTPPDSRRTSGDDVENLKQTSRQALPSISDVLGVDRPSALGNSTLIPASSHALHALPHNSSQSPTSRPLNGVSDACIPAVHSGTSNPLTTARTTYGHDRTWSDDSNSKDHRTKMLAPIQDCSPRNRIEPLTAHRMPTPTTSTSSLQGHRLTSAYEHDSMSHPSTALPPTSVAAPSAALPYGYAPYTPRSLSSAIPTNTSSNPIYQPSTSTQPPSSWSTENGSSKFATDDRHSTGAPYGESVKRHLDFFDLEAALNDIAAASGILADFSRRYGDRMHQTARTGPDIKSLPGLVEVDDMVVKSRVQLDALVKIRDVVMTQQAAYDQQAADQRQRKTFDEGNSAHSESNTDMSDAKASFIGADNKKRRGRAAPPGRCHSCNRAETPEWRRGPDGARTLCNACGLHYAKLTRKQQGTNKNVNVGSSNLRPKSSLPDA